MAITHTQLIDVFKFEPVKNSAYGIKVYRKFKSGVEIFGKKNTLEIITPGNIKETYDLECITLGELKERLPRITESAKKRKPSNVNAQDIFEVKIFRENALGKEEIIRDDFPSEMLKHSYGQRN